MEKKTAVLLVGGVILASILVNLHPDSTPIGQLKDVAYTSGWSTYRNYVSVPALCLPKGVLPAVPTTFKKTEVVFASDGKSVNGFDITYGDKAGVDVTLSVPYKMDELRTRSWVDEVRKFALTHQ